MQRLFTYLGLAFFLILCLAAPYLEANPSLHMIILLPGLAISGAYVFAGVLGAKIKLNEAYGNAAVLSSVFMILFWMLPRYIDQSLVNPLIEGFKFTSIPLIIGGGLALGWHAANPFLRGFLKSNAISMVGVLAFLYTHAPVRICNSYLISDQYQLGIHYLWVSIGLALYWSIPLFVTSKEFRRPAETRSNAAPNSYSNYNQTISRERI